MIIRKATEADVKAAAEIYESARRFMKENGNPHQWSGEYPNEYDVREGLKDGTSYVCEDEGEWLSDAPYSVIHRIAVKHHGRGIIDFCFAECFKRFPNIRIDTHEDNIPMQKCLSRCGFKYCGIIYLADGAKRLSYQKTC